MHIAAKIAIGAGVVGAGAMLLAACGGPKEQDAESFSLEKFRGFDKHPNDNKWTGNEIEQTRIQKDSQLVNTYRVGDARFGTWQHLERSNTDSMRRIFEAAKGNDAVLSLDELAKFALNRYDADKSGTLNKAERGAFTNAYGPSSTQSQWRVTGTSPYIDWDYYEESYPNPGYPGTGGGTTSPGDDGGWNPGGGGSTSPGDDGGGGGYVPPSNGGGTSPGDGGGSTPPSNGGGSTPPSSGNGNSTDNGNPNEDDF